MSVVCNGLLRSAAGGYRFDEAAYSGDIVRLRSGTGRVGARADNLTGEELQVRHADGYVSFTGQLPTYHYFIRDYQGNVVAVVSSEGDVEQRTHYYPYGGWYGESTEPLAQARKYGGKELELTAGVNWYDFGARLQRPDLCRFLTMDPLAEKYYGVSPYAYCGGNPVMYIDPSGEAWRKTVMAMQDGSISPPVMNGCLTRRHGMHKAICCRDIIPWRFSFLKMGRLWKGGSIIWAPLRLRFMA